MILNLVKLATLIAACLVVGCSVADAATYHEPTGHIMAEPPAPSPAITSASRSMQNAVGILPLLIGGVALVWAWWSDRSTETRLLRAILAELQLLNDANDARPPRHPETTEDSDVGLMVWTCLSCDAINSAIASHCHVCQTPQAFSGGSGGGGSGGGGSGGGGQPVASDRDTRGVTGTDAARPRRSAGTDAKSRSGAMG